MEIRELQPQELWEQFAEICKIPHPTFHEEAVITYIQSFAEKHSLKWKKDKTGNIVVLKPASKGKENCPTVVLQSHTDMVPQKNSDKDFDFLKDSIEPYIDGEWVKAKGTTLGSDDGMGVATMLAILQDNSLEHPALECLFTISEEDGMVGANGLGSDMLTGKILINMDSEEEGELYIGCAGGTNNNVHYKYDEEEINSPGDYVLYNIHLKGLKGGHSGIQITLQRANANKVAVRFIREQSEACGLRLVNYCGGNMRNAIPREAIFSVLIPNSKQKQFEDAVKEYEVTINQENKTQEDNITFKATTTQNGYSKVMSLKSQQNIIAALTAMPNGVFRMSDNCPGLAETSTNLSIVRIENGEFDMKCMTRCLVNYGKKEVNAMIRSIWSLIGATVFEDGEYNGWAPNKDSKILALMAETYENMYGVKPNITAIHAGLEAGIIGDKFGGMDMVSVGPTLQYPHSPDERVNIASVKRFYDFILSTLKNIK